jgi:hypothetical protein
MKCISGAQKPLRGKNIVVARQFFQLYPVATADDIQRFFRLPNGNGRKFIKKTISQVHYTLQKQGMYLIKFPHDLAHPDEAGFSAGCLPAARNGNPSGEYTPLYFV